MSASNGSDQTQFASTMQDFVKNMQDHARQHSDRWVEAQEELLTKWRALVEERSKNDERLFKDWSKSWMETGFKMLEMQRASMAETRKAQLAYIDEYLDRLKEHSDPEPRRARSRTRGSAKAKTGTGKS